MVDVTAVLPPERATFLELLASLAPREWQAATECPAWTVAGVALHVLGDDLSLLARQRDAVEKQGLILYGESHPGLTFRELLDGFNEQWVTAAEFLSPALILTLLEATGRWTADFYGAVDPHRLGEPVGLFAVTDASPYWQISAREYLERWVHQHQIRRALGRDDLGAEFLEPIGAVIAHVMAAHTRVLALPSGTTIGFEIIGVNEWTIELGESEHSVSVGAFDTPTVALAIHAEAATPILSRALPAADVVSQLRLTGPDDLTTALANGFALLAGRP